MKEIQPIQIWKDGKFNPANLFNIYVIHDNLKDTAIFFYALLSGTEDNNIRLADGNITMSGDDYIAWQDDPSLYNWIAKQLSIVFI